MKMIKIATEYVREKLSLSKIASIYFLFVSHYIEDLLVEGDLPSQNTVIVMEKVEEYSGNRKEI